jgi:glycosyltransferase involved in cell wall biosynthesis
MISVVINTFNEETHIRGCLASVQGFGDEVLVCDMQSTDNTAQIAKDAGARVVTISKAFCDFGRLRHMAVSHAQHKWVLVIDADERLTPKLAAKLTEIAANDSGDVALISNLYWYFNGWVRHGSFFNNYWPRFFKREVYLSLYKDTDELVHNDLSVLLNVTNKVVLSKEYYLEHYAYPSIEKYVSKTLGMYARVEAEQLFSVRRRFSKVTMIFEPIKSFVGRFIFRGGFKDGMRGFILAVLFAIYRFAVWANLWLLEQNASSNKR